MSKYEVSKFDVNIYNVNGLPCYSFTLHFDTWAELRKDLHARDQYAKEVFYGKGATIERDGKTIGNVVDFDHHEKAINKVTLSEFLQTNENW